MNESTYIIDYITEQLFSSVWTINNYSVLNIFWNLFLLVIPFFLCAYLIKFWQKTKFKEIHQKIGALALGFLWLMFLPNSAYVITDVRHLLDFCPVNRNRICIENAWMVMFFYVYASFGWVSLVYLINQMRDFIKRVYGLFVSRVYVFFIIPLVALGVLLGLINRWNSWEIFMKPSLIVNSVFMYLTDLTYFSNWIIFTLSLYFLYWAGDLIFLFKTEPQKNKKNKERKI